jgi:hypothetical protein
MPATIILHCPGCSARIKAPTQLVGQLRHCPGCGTPFVVRAQRPSDSAPILVTSDQWEDRPAGTHVVGATEWLSARR